MFIAGSNYWNMAYGQMPGDMEQDEEGLILDVNSRKYAVLRSVTSLSQSISLLLRGTFPMIKP